MLQRVLAAGLVACALLATRVFATRVFATRVFATRVFATPLFATPAAAQDAYPTKPIRMVIAFAGGGSTDIIARLLSVKMTETLGRQVIADNRGAGGNLGTDLVAKAAPEGSHSVDRSPGRSRKLSLAEPSLRIDATPRTSSAATERDPVRCS